MATLKPAQRANPGFGNDYGTSGSVSPWRGNPFEGPEPTRDQALAEIFENMTENEWKEHLGNASDQYKEEFGFRPKENLADVGWKYLSKYYGIKPEEKSYDYVKSIYDNYMEDLKDKEERKEALDLFR